METIKLTYSLYLYSARYSHNCQKLFLYYRSGKIYSYQISPNAWEAIKGARNRGSYLAQNIISKVSGELVGRKAPAPATNISQWHKHLAR